MGLSIVIVFIFNNFLKALFKLIALFLLARWFISLPGLSTSALSSFSLAYWQLSAYMALGAINIVKSASNLEALVVKADSAIFLVVSIINNRVFQSTLTGQCPLF